MKEHKNVYKVLALKRGKSETTLNTCGRREDNIKTDLK
jgi:hypothetical protein